MRPRRRRTAQGASDTFGAPERPGPVGGSPKRAFRGWLPPVVSGLALGATFTPHGGPVLPFLAFAPLAAALSGVGRDPTTPPLAPFWKGLVAATLAHGVGLHWMLPALSWRTPLALPAYLLVLSLIGLVAGAACLAAMFLHGRARWPLPLALAACWTGFEWFAARAPGVPYAWLNAGASLAWHPSLAAGAELFGARFLTFWTVAVGSGVGVAASGRTLRGLPAAPVWLLAVAVAAPAVGGWARQSALRAGAEAAATAAPLRRAEGPGEAKPRAGATAARDSLRIAAVQPGRAGAGFDRWRDALLALHANDPFDLVVLPERFAALLREPGARAPTEAGARLETLARELGVPVVTGALDAEIAGPGARPGVRAAPGDTVWYNAAFAMTPAGALSPAYRKVRLVPGLEGAGWAGLALGDLGRAYAVGDDPRPLRPGGGLAPIGVLICYDSAYESTARALLRRGADWLLVLSNDDWLDPERPFRTTWAYWQHATHAVLRAIENRAAVVQVASTGRTFAVSSTGDPSPPALAPGEDGVAVLAAAPRRAPTLYARTGDWLGPACFAILALTTLWAGPWLSFRASRERATPRSTRSNLD